MTTNKAFNDLLVNDVFVNVLSETLSDRDLRRIFSFHGEIQFPKSTNNVKKLKTEEQIVINFKSRNHLIRTIAAIHTKFEEIRKNDFSINNLPDDCLVHIFSFLPLLDKVNIDNVCKRWRDISGRVFAGTKELDLRDLSSKNTVYRIIKRCGPFAKVLKFPSLIVCEALEMAQKFCQLNQLREVELDFNHTYFIYPKLFQEHLKKLLRETKNLVTLVIQGCVYDLDELILLCSQTLENLNVWNTGQQSTIINLDCFPNLRELSCRNVDIFGTDGQINPETATHIERLELCSNRISRSFIDNIKLCTNLRRIRLDNNVCQMSADDILDIVTNCQRIQGLRLDGSFVLTSQCLRALGRMPSLENLYMGSIRNAEALHLQHLTNLKELTVSDCHYMSEHRGLMQLITDSSKLSKLNLFCANMLDKSFPEAVVSVFTSGLRKTPLNLKIHIEHGTWSGKYKHGFDHPLLKLALLQDYSESDHSELEEMMWDSGSND